MSESPDKKLPVNYNQAIITNYKSHLKNLDVSQDLSDEELVEEIFDSD